MAMVVAAAAMASAAAALPFSSSSSLSPPRMPTIPFLRYPQHHHLSSLTSRPPLRLPHKRAPPSSSPRSQVSDDADSSAMGSAASPTGDSVVNEVALLAEEPDTPGVGVATKPRKPSPLQRGGTLAGKQAEGKDPSPAALGKSSPRLSSTGKFEDSRWKDGTWNLQQFTKDGKVDWDSVIDAEVLRRKWLEENPEASSNEEPVVFETSVIPWWAWVKRFHLPEAELLNGRAAMVGFFMAYIVDGLTGVGLVDQTSSFLGKLLLFVAVVGILLIRKNEDLANLRQLAKEWNFYDKQWQATWQEGQPPAGSEKQK